MLTLFVCVLKMFYFLFLILKHILGLIKTDVNFFSFFLSFQGDDGLRGKPGRNGLPGMQVVYTYPY